MSSLHVEGMSVGPLETNCYILHNPETHEAVVIDPGSEPERILARIQELELRVLGIWLTHAHGDHIGAVGPVKDATRAPVCIHGNEAEWLTDPNLNLSAMIGAPIMAPPADILLSPGEPLEAVGTTWEILDTPGHSPGGVSFHADGLVITGDALFAGSIGRTDLPYGDLETLTRSIQEALYVLPDETVVYPGHGTHSTIGEEKRTNPFVRAS